MFHERRSLESITRRCSAKLKLIAVLFLTNVTICLSVKVTIFYESLCPDCVDFFNDQFDHCWHHFGDTVTWEMVPYGNVEEINAHGETRLECQHGKPECEANAIQACLLSKSADPKIAFGFITCYMQQKDKAGLGSKCARLYNVDYPDINACATSNEGFDSLLRQKDRTNQILPAKRFIPAIAFDDVYTAADSEEGRLNLLRAICRRLNTNKPCICNGI